MIHRVRDMNINGKAVMPTRTSQLSITEVHPRHSHLPSADCRFFNIFLVFFFSKLQKVFKKKLLHKSKQKLFRLFWWKNPKFHIFTAFFSCFQMCTSPVAADSTNEKECLFYLWFEMSGNGSTPTHTHTPHIPVLSSQALGSKQSHLSFSHWCNICESNIMQDHKAGSVCAG